MRRASNVEEFCAGNISLEDSLKDEECFVRNVSRKTLRLVTDLKNSGSDLFFSVPASKKSSGTLLSFFASFFEVQLLSRAT